jgi:hypothetical protein
VLVVVVLMTAVVVVVVNRSVGMACRAAVSLFASCL